MYIIVTFNFQTIYSLKVKIALSLLIDIGPQVLCPYESLG